MGLPIQSYRKWAKIFRKAGARFVRFDGKNHQVWAYLPKGAALEATVSIPAHSEGADVLDIYIREARRIWRLREVDGVSDHDFLQGRWS